MAGNFEGIKTRNFGIEIEMTGLTRCQAARAIAKVLGGTAFHEGGSYDKYTVDDEQGRTWSIVYDGSVKCVDANGNSALFCKALICSAVMRVSSSSFTTEYCLIHLAKALWDTPYSCSISA